MPKAIDVFIREYKDVFLHKSLSDILYAFSLFLEGDKEKAEGILRN